jgi:hypothetical protein
MGRFFLAGLRGKEGLDRNNRCLPRTAPGISFRFSRVVGAISLHEP